MASEASTKKSLEIASPHLLLVEGGDERRLLEILMRRLGLRELIQMEDYKGIAKLGQFLSPLSDSGSLANLESLGIIRDADSSAAGSFDSVCSQLLKFKLDRPSRHGNFTAGRPRVGVYIMPDGQSNGMLEDLCLQSVSDHPALPCVEGYIECLGGREITLKNPSKSRVHALLASYDDGAKRLGEAAESKSSPLWNLDHPAFDGLKAFLRDLAGGGGSTA